MNSFVISALSIMKHLQIRKLVKLDDDLIIQVKHFLDFGREITRDDLL